MTIYSADTSSACLSTVDGAVGDIFYSLFLLNLRLLHHLMNNYGQALVLEILIDLAKTLQLSARDLECLLARTYTSNLFLECFFLDHH